MPANQSTALNDSIENLDFLYSPLTHSLLIKAANTFIKYRGGTTEVWASSRDWFQEEWGRDTFISLPGLLLTTGRFEEAKQVFNHFKDHEKNGLIPNVIRSDKTIYNTADASLWFIHALKSYAYTTQDWTFISSMLPTVQNIIRSYINGTGYDRFGKHQLIGMDINDGLIISPAQASWMDADPSK